MEPFELKLHQVTFEESDNTLGQGEGQPQPHLDSFSALVHYDANFDSKAGAEKVTKGSELQDFTFAALGRDLNQGKVWSTTSTTPTTTGPQSTSANSGGSPSQRLPLPWEGRYVGDEEGQENFLVNPDDYLSPAPHAGKVSPEVAAAGLRTLSQVSINTSAIARHLRKLKGGKRRVAKTTVTSTALTTPRTMPTETPPSSSSPSARPVASPATSPSTGEGEGEGPGDSSFETVAEALRLQWSVIGNANVTPASPEEVARIVAEAEKRLRGESVASSVGEAAVPHLALPGDPAVSDLPSVGSVSSLSSLSSSTTNDNGVTGMDAHLGRVSDPGEGAPPAELIRVPATSITKEVEKTSWFQSRDRAGLSAVQQQLPDSGQDSSRTGPDSRRGAGGGTAVDSGSRSSGVGRKGGGGSEHTGNGLTGVERSAPTAATGPDGEPSTVPLGSGVVPPTSDLCFQSPPAGSMPYTSPPTSTQSTALPERAPLPQQQKGLHQRASSHSQQQDGEQQAPSPRRPLQDASPQPPVSSSFVSGVSSQQAPSSSPTPPQSASPHASSQQTSARGDSTPGSLIPASPLPSFDPSLSPLPQIGPLFPKKAAAIPWRQTGGEGEGRSEGSGGGGGMRGREVEELLREKLKLEGQLEVLQEEAQATLQDRAQLHAQLASLQLKLRSGQQKADDAEKANLRAELERLRATRLDHEREALEVQHMLEEKLEELKVVTEDLFQSQDTVDKLQVRMKELRDDLQSREATVQALKSKIAELYVEVQTTLQSKMEADSDARMARNDLVSLVKAKEWYQEQLSTAHEVRAKLQSQLTQLQAQTVSQGSIVERLKLESGRLRQQLRESQERALREKEQLARHLEAIQHDMMEREAAFQEIQRERLMIEDTFNTQVTTAEEEKNRLSSLLQLTTDLEGQVEQAQAHSRKRQEQVLALETQRMDLLKRAALLQEGLQEKEHLLEEAQQKLIEVESQVEAFRSTLAARDTELARLREDKASTEIALKAALQEKESVDRALGILKGDMGKVEKSFKQMRQELGTRVTELEAAQTQQKAARDELDRVAHELDIKTRSVDTLTQSFQEQVAVIEQLRAEKDSTEQQLAAVQQQLQQAQGAEPVDPALLTELQETRAQLAQAQDRLQVATAQLQQSSTTTATTAASPQHPQDSGPEASVAERDRLARQLQEADEARQEAERERQQLHSQLAGLQSELDNSKTEFERKVETHVAEIHRVAEEKRRLETELEMSRRKFELSSVQQQESINLELQKLVKELESAQLRGQEVEEELQRLRGEKEGEVGALRGEVSRLQEALEESSRRHSEDSAARTSHLALELEKERGRIAGLQQSNSTLKEHMKQLEEALAGRESSLIELNSHLESGNREREKEQQEYLKRIQELEVSLKKEKDSGRDLRKQIGSKLTENKRLQKQQESLRKEQGLLQEEAERRQEEAAGLQGALESARQAVRQHQEELQSLQAEKLALEAEVERARRELVDSRDRNPVLLEQIQSLEWQVSQRGQEVQAAREQLALAEQRQASETDSLRRALQDKQEEVDGLQAEVAQARQEKANQKSRVAELRSVLKASVQHHKLTKKLNSGRKDRGGAGDADGREEKGTQADMGNGVIIPPLPFDMEVVEQLLLDTAVKPLDSKPLDNLSSCLSSLRQEISGLQKQMEVHTTTIHSSAVSWRSVESEVKGLQEVVRSMANTIMDGTTTTSPATTTTATDTELVDDADILHL
ncbi:uncharacterized protein LOC143288332 [Babylonia areolata]|uniref:uncharacterized protein LOC143288332 n=1 Tax=Babylonia areolata TaxID=304850 RepID=UPI003FD1FC32